MARAGFREVKDSMGAMEVPEDALWGAQTQRAIENFPISGTRLPNEFIQALAHIKWAAAEINGALGLLPQERAKAIQSACDGILSGKNLDQFPVDVFQTGSGTSSNMNANEVIARWASEISGTAVHPNDDVNLGQSSNDVIPTAIHVSAAMAIQQQLLPNLDYLHAKLMRKSEDLSQVVKTGRTHLMDAMPVTFGQEVGAWAHQIAQAKERINGTLPRLHQLAQGGTAVGTGINAHPEFAQRFAQVLVTRCGLPFEPSENRFAALACQDTAVEVSGALKTAAVAIMKLSNDLRWMNSGPLAGFAEIALPALQPGSSIMPGKVNPVIPEAAAMVAAQIIGNDTTITVAGQSGNFQLNVMLPLIANSLLQSVKLLSNVCVLLADQAIEDFVVIHENIEEALARNPILVTALNPVIGYEQGAKIAKRAYKEKRSVLDVALEETELSEEQLRRLLDPAKLTRGGIQD
ncbi:MAG: class II fumarate hydratase [Pseudomonadota bacterium]